MARTESPESVLYSIVEELNRSGKHYQSTVQGLELKGIGSYGEMKSKIRGGEIIIYRAPMIPSDSVIPKIVAPPSFWTISLILSVATFGIPVVAIALSILLSWWFILLALLIPYLMGRTRDYYTNMLIGSALHSEIEFCCLYQSDIVRLANAEGDPL